MTGLCWLNRSNLKNSDLKNKAGMMVVVSNHPG